ncbi:hypothetical protein [Phenylobacterium sp.]|uniref:hypothetical protein n=1 Tax=Phenylobacterium sp. TaxID=1871053 RepID=UPI003933C204
MSADPDALRLQAMERDFADVIARARAGGADLADVLACAAQAIGRTMAAIPDDTAAWEGLVGVTMVARRAYREERAAMARAEGVVYGAAGARNRRGRR